MANLSIRKLDDHVYKLLQLRALSHHVSMEEEVRSILTDALNPSLSITQIFAHNFSCGIAENLEVPPKKFHDPIEFDDDYS
jgi:plasmid stability protein